MIPTPRALAEMALRRQEELSRQLSSAHASPGGSLLPDVLRRAIVTVSVCHETLRTLQEATENGSKSASHHVPSAASGGGGWRQRGRYGFVADSAAIGGPRTLQEGDAWRLRRAHLVLAVEGALLAYGDLLCASDRHVQRAALDSLLDYLVTLEIESEPGSSPRLRPVSEGSRKIRVVLDARRKNAESSNPLYRDIESFTVEGMAWSYCAELIAEALRPESQGSADVRAAVRRVDDVRAALEHPGLSAAAHAPSF